eukprot:6175291-Pleurochrysis_carterae.AAC.1
MTGEGRAKTNMRTALATAPDVLWSLQWSWTPIRAAGWPCTPTTINLATHRQAAALRHCPFSYGKAVWQRCVCDVE